MISTDGGLHWSRRGSNLPHATTLDVDAGRDGLLCAATHGRGIWSTPHP